VFSYDVADPFLEAFARVTTARRPRPAADSRVPACIFGRTGLDGSGAVCWCRRSSGICAMRPSVAD
jgi:hypothetical protein